MSHPPSSDSHAPIVVETAHETRESIVAAVAADEAFRTQIASADLLVVPLAGHAGYVAPVFPQGTLEVLEFMRERLPDGLAADIAVQDEAYEELTLHAADILLPTLLADPVASGVAINLLSSYLYDLFKDVRARREARVRARVLVETRTRTVSIAYDGPADQFAELTRLALEREVPEAERSAEPRRLIDVARPDPRATAILAERATALEHDAAGSNAPQSDGPRSQP